MLILFSLILTSVSCGAASFPKPLSSATEKELLEKKSEGDISAKNTLIEHNLRLVAHIVKKYSSNSSLNEDLLSIGTIGLIKAIDSFKADKNTRLATYAAKCIENEILMYLRRQKKISTEVYLQSPLSVDKDGNEISLIDTLISDDDSVDDEAELNIYSVMLKKAVNTVLTPREKLIITLRYGLGKSDVYTQREIAKKLNISRSYVSRIEKKALSKLKDCFEE